MTKNPEEIRGGGLLRYCNLITRGFKVIEDDNTNKLQTLERFHRTKKIERRIFFQIHVSSI